MYLLPFLHKLLRASLLRYSLYHTGVSFLRAALHWYSTAGASATASTVAAAIVACTALLLGTGEIPIERSKFTSTVAAVMMTSSSACFTVR
jgi:hypothetical protein